jgi:hypothetical protein
LPSFASGIAFVAAMKTWIFEGPATERRGEWRWKQFDEGQLAQQSTRLFGSMHEAIEDATSLGFDAMLDRWEITDPGAPQPAEPPE